MEGARPRFTLGRQSSLAPSSNDGEGGSASSGLPEKLDKAMQLLFLSCKGDEEGIRALVAEGADVNIGDFDDRTALHVAACEGHAKVVEFLLKQGANVNARDRWGSTPLSDAKHYANKDVCKILESAGAKLPESSKKVPMQVTNPTDVPEYEVKAGELRMQKKDAKLTEYKVAKWHGILVAVKEIPGDLSSQPQIVKAFRDELALLQKLRHPNIVQFLGAVTQRTPMCIIMEHCAGGDLHNYLQAKGRLAPGKAVRYALDMARGLNYLHECKPESIIHGDLKPRCILRDRVGHLKVADFGLSQILHGASEISKDQNGPVFSGSSCYYMAPEVLRGEAYDKTVDVFSFALILQQMIEGCPPFHDKNEEEVMNDVAYKNGRPPFKAKDKYYPGGLKELIKLCWDSNPVERPNFAMIITELEKIKPLCDKQSFWRRAFGAPKRSLSLRSLSLQ